MIGNNKTYQNAKTKNTTKKYNNKNNKQQNPQKKKFNV